MNPNSLTSLRPVNVHDPTRDAYWDAYRTLNNLADLAFDLHMRMITAGVPTGGVVAAQEALAAAAKAIRTEQLDAPMPVSVS